MIVRSQLSTIIERMQEPRKCIQVLAGPRQVGKTTLIKQFLAQCTIPATSLNADHLYTKTQPKSKAIHRLSTAYPPDKGSSKQKNPALHF